MDSSSCNRLFSWCNGIDQERHIFSVVLACISGFRGPMRARIHDEIVRAGGAVSSNLTANCTHLITSELSGEKCRKAMDMANIKIVSALWVDRSLLHGRMESEDGYCARAPLASFSQAPVNDSLLLHGEQVAIQRAC